MEKTKLNKLVFAALFAALALVATMIIRIPSLGGNGYVNIGDTIVLLSGWILGGVYGAAAAGLGSCLADLFAGYALYVPGTFVIKFAMALAAWAIYRVMAKEGKTNTPALLVSGIAAEVIMVVGYLLYEAICLGYGAGAFPAIISNIGQGVTNIVLALVLQLALQRSKAIKTLVESNIKG